MAKELTISIDEGTLILAAQILKDERGIDDIDLEDAAAAITKAAQRLTKRNRETTTNEEPQNV
ncbi:hypothetical protein FBT96_12355 [Rhodobacter capsulatus]|uniref:Uncharacterized protein n=1 Tax=Rhodobacter capsulatus TaxID=1061 RepID=A0A4U1JPM7_RHOCA|nr:hypothetical protein [Rhodobacter capsulatus]TKD17930.1 hypothetical protein FBT96_12355 [Rhodobacter capsulatus]